MERRLVLLPSPCHRCTGDVRPCWTLLDWTLPHCLRFGDINFLSRIDLLSGPLANHLMPGQHIQHQETGQTHVAMVKTCENMLQKVGIGPNSER